MQETTNVEQAKSADQSTVWDALIAAAIRTAIGALFAVLVCVPYDQVFGLSTALCVGLRYTASVVVFATCLSGGRPTKQLLVYQVGHT
jgi:VIT1/CCC1 family predicted Fe2+/Mn2+ transporter